MESNCSTYTVWILKMKEKNGYAQSQHECGLASWDMTSQTAVLSDPRQATTTLPGSWWETNITQPHFNLPTQKPWDLCLHSPPSNPDEHFSLRTKEF